MDSLFSPNARRDLSRVYFREYTAATHFQSASHIYLDFYFIKVSFLLATKPSVSKR